MKTFEEYRREVPQRYPRWFCWLRLRRHTFEEHLGVHNLFVYSVCTQCGFPKHPRPSGMV